MSRVIVLDCCTTIAWLGHQHITEKQRVYAQQVLGSLNTHSQLLVPTLWTYELSNTLLSLLKTRYITESDCQLFLESLQKLPIQVVPEPVVESVSARIRMAQHHKLSAYDAAYLNIATAHRAPLATLDNKLIAAARANGVYFQ